MVFITSLCTCGPSEQNWNIRVDNLQKKIQWNQKELFKKYLFARGNNDHRRKTEFHPPRWSVCRQKHSWQFCWFESQAIDAVEIEFGSHSYECFILKKEHHWKACGEGFISRTFGHLSHFDWSHFHIWCYRFWSEGKWLPTWFDHSIHLSLWVVLFCF